MEREIIDSFFQGQCIHAYKVFGAQLLNEGESGVRFTLWAPNAQRVEVIGSFNDWDGSNHVMHREYEQGVYTLYIPEAKELDMYKYRITQADGIVKDKSDPFSFYNEERPKTASVVVNKAYKKWKDKKWMKNRTKNFDRPLNIYEVHLGSWKHDENGSVNYKKIAKELTEYVLEHNFTHIEFMPLTEHPFDGSWGYQSSGYYAMTSRYGSIQDLKYLINYLHTNNIGVIFDFVPVHFVMDDFALVRFDGTHQFEYMEDENAYSEWGTANFNLWREEVRSFLMSAASYAMDEFHIDGLRVDAVSNVIYWQGNRERGINDGGLAFIKRMNYFLSKEYNGVMLIAEDSSDFYGVTKSTLDGGLGFDYKWDLGWMNDTLAYLKLDPVYRQYQHNKINFSMAYFYNERFILPFSHDEVVHSKATIVDKMWGLYHDKFAQARMLYGYMFMHPGKKLNFMSNEYGQLREFDEKIENDWFMLEYPMHDSFRVMFKDLGEVYTNHPALYESDYDWNNFEWIDADNGHENLYSFIRKGKEETIVVVVNMSTNTYEDHYFGVSESGFYKEIFNSDDSKYHGNGVVNKKAVRAKKGYVDYRGYYISVNVPRFSTIVFHHKNKLKKET